MERPRFRTATGHRHPRQGPEDTRDRRHQGVGTHPHVIEPRISDDPARRGPRRRSDQVASTHCALQPGPQPGQHRQERIRAHRSRLTPSTPFRDRRGAVALDGLRYQPVGLPRLALSPGAINRSLVAGGRTHTPRPPPALVPDAQLRHHAGRVGLRSALPQAIRQPVSPGSMAPPEGNSGRTYRPLHQGDTHGCPVHDQEIDRLGNRPEQVAASRGHPLSRAWCVDVLRRSRHALEQRLRIGDRDQARLFP